MRVPSDSAVPWRIAFPLHPITVPGPFGIWKPSGWSSMEATVYWPHESRISKKRLSPCCSRCKGEIRFAMIDIAVNTEGHFARTGWSAVSARETQSISRAIRYWSGCMILSIPEITADASKISDIQLKPDGFDNIGLLLNPSCLPLGTMSLTWIYRRYVDIPAIQPWTMQETGSAIRLGCLPPYSQTARTGVAKAHFAYRELA